MSIKLLWLDLETTGLDPALEKVLEVAAVLTDENLEPIDSFERVIGYTSKQIESMRSKADPHVQKMHDGNGLWEACERSTTFSEDVVNELEAWGFRNAVYRHQSRTYLSGASVHFDRSFLEYFAPEFVGRLNHRHVDVSVLRFACDTWSPGTFALGWPSNNNHRAMGDVLDSIAQARVARKILGSK